jgi:hypothetical protein
MFGIRRAACNSDVKRHLQQVARRICLQALLEKGRTCKGLPAGGYLTTEYSVSAVWVKCLKRSARRRDKTDTPKCVISGRAEAGAAFDCPRPARSLITQ